MKTLFYSIIGFLLTAKNTLALSLEDFDDEVFRPDNLPTLQSGNTSVEEKINVLTFNIVEIILFASGSIAVLILVIGGVRYIASLGNQEQMDAAKKTIKFAVIGLLVIILAFAIVTNVIDIIYRSTV